MIVIKAILYFAYSQFFLSSIVFVFRSYFDYRIKEKLERQGFFSNSGVIIFLFPMSVLCVIGVLHECFHEIPVFRFVVISGLYVIDILMMVFLNPKHIRSIDNSFRFVCVTLNTLPATLLVNPISVLSYIFRRLTGK